MASAGAMWRHRAGVVPAGVEDKTVAVNRVQNFREPTGKQLTAVNTHLERGIRYSTVVRLSICLS